VAGDSGPFDATSDSGALVAGLVGYPANQHRPATVGTGILHAQPVRS
jgi:hypothetical protein